MNFVYPNFLWALSLIAIPILIHLFYFRRYKKVLFSNVAFLNEVKDERSTRNRLKHLLVLLSRILAIIFLVLAFAQPYFDTGKGEEKKQKYISIYIDNSFSMNAEGNGQLLFDEAKEIASSVINSYAENDPAEANKYQILTNDFEGKHQRLVNKTEAQSLLKGVQISPASRSSKLVFERQRSIFKNMDSENIVYQLSDYQINNKLFKIDKSITTSMVKLSLVEKRNIYIDSIWFNDSYQLKGADNEMIVRFKNESNEAVTGNYQMTLNAEVKSIGEYQIAENGSSLDTINFKISETGWNTGKIQISDYPITFDDEYFYSFYVEEKVKVLNITQQENSKIFDAVFQEIENIDYESIDYKNIDYNSLNEYHFIILDRIQTLASGLSQNMNSYIENGGNVFLVPHKQSSLNSYNVLLSSLGLGSFITEKVENRQVSTMNLKHYILNDLFEKTPRDIKLPSIQRYFQLKTKMNVSEQKILSFRNQESFLSSYNIQNGNIYVVNAALDPLYSDFKANTLFAPIVYKMAVSSVTNHSLSSVINAETKMSLKQKSSIKLKNEEVVKVQNIDKSSAQIEFIPQKNLFGGKMNLNIRNQNLESGIYNVFVNSLSDKENLIAKVALNYNRKESQLEYYSQEDLENAFPDENVSVISGNINKIKENIIQLKSGNKLWKWLIVISLLFLAFEILLLRILK